MNLLQTARLTGRILDSRTRVTLALAAVASILLALLDSAALALILPLVTLASGEQDTSGIGLWVRELLGSPDPDTLVPTLTLAVMALFILKGIGGLLFTWWLAGFKVLKRVELSTRILESLLGAPYTSVSRRSAAELLRTVNDAVIQFFGTTVYALMTIVSNIATLIAIVLALFLSAPIPTLAVAAYFGAASTFYLYVMKPRSQEAGRVSAEATSEAYRTALAALGGIKESKLRGSQPFFVNAYQNAARRGAYAGRTAEFISSTPRYLLEILFIIAIGAILLFGSVADSTGPASSVGVLAVFVAGGLRALPATTSLMGQLSNIRFGSRYLDIVRAEVEELQARPDDPAPPTVPRYRLNDRISLENVSFRYPDASSDALKDITLDISRGSSVALVGGSGAGKTTLVDLLLGLHHPTAGRILLDGLELERNLVSWQRSIGYVPQEVFLREATLAENVAFDVNIDEIDRLRLRRAIEGAQLSELVSRLPDGVETPVGDRGSRLSGGQRQRVGIARALYQEPEVLVLDEATSALDNETEHEIAEAVGRLTGRLTLIVVAHRLSTIRHVDRVIFLHDGQIEAMGSFESVQELSPRFAKMVELGSLN